MSKFRSLSVRTARFLSFILVLLVLQPAIATPQYWFGGEDTVTTKQKGRALPADYMALFVPDSPWQKGASQLGVFSISTQFATSSKEQDLDQLIADLRRRKIAMGIEMGMLRADRGCGRGEGYMPKETLQKAMKRIKAAGGRVDYVTMDGCIFNGRERTWSAGPRKLPPCCDSLEELAREIAETVGEIHQYFPNAIVGESDPVFGDIDSNGKPSRVQPAAVVRDYARFADLFREKTGRPLAFFHADIAVRSKGWMPYLAQLKEQMVSRGIRFGFYVGGNPDFKDDLSWTKEALRLLRTLDSNSATSADDIVVGSWQPFPTRFLPENQEGTATWELLQSMTIGNKLARR